MKPQLSLLTFLFALLLICGCNQRMYVQLFEVKPNTALQVADEDYVFENDTVKITYDFWDEHGNLSFTLYNKLNVPLYIDWRKSSYVRNDSKLNYWTDEETAVTNSTYTSFLYGRSSFAVASGNGTSVSKVARPERITFLAPKSLIEKKQFVLVPDGGVSIAEDKAKYTECARNDDPSKQTTVCYRDYSSDESMLRFRNFLTISTTENFASEFYIDNGFFLQKISTMDQRHFARNANLNHDSRFADTRNFYITLDKDLCQTIEYKYFKKRP